MGAHDALLAEAARTGLTMATSHTPHAPSRIDDDLVMAAAGTRTTGFVLAAVEAGHLSADDRTLGRLNDAHLTALRSCVTAETEAAIAVRRLTQAGIASRLMKGIALSHLDYPDPAMRTFADADLLVRRSDVGRALDCLAVIDVRRHEPAIRAWWERRYGKSVVLQTPSGAEIDLHLTLTGGYFGLAVDHRDLFADEGDAFEIAGVPVIALPREMRLVQACYHSVLGHGSGLRAMRDIAQLLTDEGVLESARRWARRWRGEAVIAVAVRAAWDALHLDPRHEAAQWAAAHEVTSGDVERIAGYHRRSSGWADEGLGATGALAWPDRVAYATALAFPSRASLRARHRTVRQHLTRVATLGRR